MRNSLFIRDAAEALVPACPPVIQGNPPHIPTELYLSVHGSVTTLE